jgi:LysM repeat protein
MKNNTLHRQGISRERIAALEELLSDNNTPYDSSPGVYVRSDKDRELDILWQGFKVNAKEDRSPGIYLTIGFITGAICMFLMTTILNMGNPSKESFAELNMFKRSNEIKKEKTVPVTLTPASQTSSNTYSKTEKYTIQDGDTLEKVALRFYGSPDPSKIEQIQSANGIDNPTRIQIGQEITIPVNN